MLVKTYGSSFNCIHSNAQMSTKQLQKFCHLDEKSQQMLKIAMEKIDLSARVYDRIFKVARTITDLETAKNISTEHITEAI